MSAQRPPSELLIAAVAALMVIAFGSLLFLSFGQSPLHVWGLMIADTFGDPYAIGQVVYKATALVFTGLAVALALDAQLFNIGVEGQMALGILTCSVAAAALPDATPGVVAIPIALAAAAAGGGALGALTGLLRVHRGAHEVITGIMMNAVVYGVILWIGNAVLFQHGTTLGPAIVPGAELPVLGLGGSAASVATFLSLAAAGALWALRSRSRWGLRWRSVGLAPRAAEAAGVRVGRVQIVMLAASGAIAALAAAGFVLGHKHAFEEGLGRGVGYLGVAVGLLGRNHPGGVVIAALFVGFLSHGGLVVSGVVPKEVTELLLGLAVLAVAVAAPTVARLATAPRATRAPASRPPPGGHASGPPGGHASRPPPGGHASGPPGGHASGPPGGRSSGPPDGHASGPPGGQEPRPPDGHASGPPGGHASGPPGGPASGPHGGHTSGPPGGHTSRPSRGPAGGPSVGPASGPPDGHASGPPAGQEPYRETVKLAARTAASRSTGRRDLGAAAGVETVT